MVAQPWLAYRLSSSGLALGLVAGSWGLSMLLFSLFGGVVADRLDWQRMVAVFQLLLCALAVVNAGLVAADRTTIWHLVGIGMTQGTVYAPVPQAYTPELVAEDDLPNALVLDAMGTNVTHVLPLSLVGVLLATDH